MLMRSSIRLISSSLRTLAARPAPTRVPSAAVGVAVMQPRRYSSDEASQSRAAAKAHVKGAVTLFDRIIAKEIPAKIIYEDQRCLAFEDVAPQAPVHFLVIPKVDVLDMVENSTEHHEATLGHLMAVAGRLGKERAPNGFRVVVNNGADGCQSVYHLHLHVLGGRQLKWPPG